MILVDTSAWIEFLRGTGSRVCDSVDRFLDADLAICDAVSMEILAGARDGRHLIRLRGLVARASMLPTTSGDYEVAASMFRSCRAHGDTVRKLVDCLIGAVAVRSGAEVLHADTDFVALARHAGLRVHPDSLS